MDADKPLGERNYEQFADRYAKLTRRKPHNALYERPATLSLLPDDMSGLKVLDAGCGPGHYAQDLLARGADLVGFDVTPRMVEISRALVGDAATFHVADLARPLDFASDAEFDLVIAPLVLDYIEDWAPVFVEFARVLRPGGRLVYSHGHPMSDFHLVRHKHNLHSEYFEVEAFESKWTGFGEPYPTVHAFRRPLGAMLNPLNAAGFVIEQVLEPKPDEELRRVNSKLYARLADEPCFLCVRARKE